MNQLSRTFEEYATLVLSFLISLIFYRRKDLTSADIRRITVIKLDHIGDVILSIPAIANLRLYFPQARITMAVNPSSEPIARLIPYVDEILCYNARFFDRSSRTKIFDLARGMKFARDMRKRQFDLIMDLRGSFASLFFAVIAKSRYRIDRGTYLVNRKLDKISLTLKHEAEIALDMLAQAGIPIRSKEMSINFTQEDLNYADLLLKPYSELDLFIVIHPGGPMSLKCWSVIRYIQLIRQLLQKYHAQIFLVGGKDERQINQSIVSAINDSRIIDLSGQTTLGQLTALLRKADLFIGNDSGPMHIASVCGTRVIGLFGPTDPQRFCPYGAHCTALRMERTCPPCAQNQCKFPGYRCIDQISVNDVMEVVNSLPDMRRNKRWMDL